MAYVRDEMVERLRPSGEEVSSVMATVDQLMRRIESAKDQFDLGPLGPGDLESLLVGSVAKGTYLSDPDIDIFIRFPESTDREELERIGLEIGKAVVPEGETRFAEHPYTHGPYNGFEVDIVPCFRVPSGAEIKSNVDRTPFHTAFVIHSLTPRTTEEILLFKRFLKGIGVYGAEIRIEGFSGYLTEIIVLKYGGFQETLKAASGWKEGQVLHITAETDTDEWRGEHVGTENTRFGAPLNVVDPVDPNRNVAAAVSGESLSVLIAAAREFIRSPDEGFFFPKPLEAVSNETLRNVVEERGTSVIIADMPRPDLVDDVLYSQIKKTRNVVQELLERSGIGVIGASFMAGDRLQWAWELDRRKLPSSKVHAGPPVVTGNASRFIEKWKDSRVWVEDGRLMTIAPRKHTDAVDIVMADLEELNLGKDLNQLKKQFELRYYPSEDGLATSSETELLLTMLFYDTLPWLR